MSSKVWAEGVQPAGVCGLIWQTVAVTDGDRDGLPELSSLSTVGC